MVVEEVEVVEVVVHEAPHISGQCIWHSVVEVRQCPLRSGTCR